MSRFLAIAASLIPSLAWGDIAYFRPADSWDAVPRSEMVYICGAHVGYGHVDLFLWNGVTVDFNCPGEPGSMDGQDRNAGFYVDGLSDVTILNARIKNVGRAILIKKSQRVIVRGGEFSENKNGVACIELADWTADVLIERTYIHDCRNGIWAGTVPTTFTPHLRLQITGNMITDIYGSGDSHGIAIQTAEDSVVSNNVVMRTDGPAIAWYWWNAGHSMNRNSVGYNTIVDIRRSGRSTMQTTPRGIDFGSSNGTSRTRCDNKILSNVILRVEGGEAVYAKGSLIPGPDCEPVSIIDNYTDGYIRTVTGVSGGRRPHMDGNTAALGVR